MLPIDNYAEHAFKQYPTDHLNYVAIPIVNKCSDLLAQSNAAVIEKTMQEFPDVEFVQFYHYLVGEICAVKTPVYNDNGEFTPAFLKIYELKSKCAGPLNPDTYAEIVEQATVDNIACSTHNLTQYKLPHNWAVQVYNWLSKNDPNAVQNIDDRGGYPSTDELTKACESLFLKDAYGQLS